MAAARTLLVAALCACAAAATAYNHMVLPPGNTTVLPVAHTPYFLQVFGLGADGLLYYKYQQARAPFSNWTLVSTNKTHTFDSDPQVGVNADGTVEIFIRATSTLDMWQVYLMDPTDPTSWSTPRGSSNFFSTIGATPNPNSTWNVQPVFPTSDPSVLTNPDGALEVFFRGFDGALYSVKQQVPGSPIKYTAPLRYPTIME